MPGIARNWTRLQDYSDEVSLSRIYAGFHYRFFDRGRQGHGSQDRGAAPPALDTPAWTRDLNEIRELVRDTASSARLKTMPPFRPPPSTGFHELIHRKVAVIIGDAVAIQIAGWLKRTYPMDLQKQVSHETIYRSLFIQARGVPTV